MVCSEWIQAQMPQVIGNENALQNEVKENIIEEVFQLQLCFEYLRKDRLSGLSQHSVKLGPKPYLDNSELVSFIKQCASMGYGKHVEM